MSTAASQQMQAILFGSILTITTDQIIGFAVFDLLLLAVVSVIFHPLLFSSLDDEVAAGRARNSSRETRMRIRMMATPDQ